MIKYQYIYTFRSIHDVMEAEKIIKASPVPVAYALIPTPRSISSDCGFSLSMPEEYKFPHFNPASCYRFNEKEKAYEKIS